MTTKKLTVRIENEVEKTRFRQIINIELLKKIKKTTKKARIKRWNKKGRELDTTTMKLDNWYR